MRADAGHSSASGVERGQTTCPAETSAGKARAPAGESWSWAKTTRRKSAEVTAASRSAETAAAKTATNVTAAETTAAKMAAAAKTTSPTVTCPRRLSKTNKSDGY